MIRQASAADAAAIAAIYNHYIVNTLVTFEEEPVTPAGMASRLREIAEAGLPWLVASDGSGLSGFAYASRWKGRCAYRYSVEITVYLAPSATGQGIGSRLYEALFAKLRELSIHTVLGGISLPNEASVALHEKFGMRKAAHFSEVGFKFGAWVDVGYWQGRLEG